MRDENHTVSRAVSSFMEVGPTSLHKIDVAFDFTLISTKTFIITTPRLFETKHIFLSLQLSCVSMHAKPNTQRHHGPPALKKYSIFGLKPGKSDEKHFR